MGKTKTVHERTNLLTQKHQAEPSVPCTHVTVTDIYLHLWLTRSPEHSRLFVLQQKAKEATTTADEQQTEAADSGLRRRRRHVEVFLLTTLTYRHLSYCGTHRVSMETP